MIYGTGRYRVAGFVIWAVDRVSDAISAGVPDLAKDAAFAVSPSLFELSLSAGCQVYCLKAQSDRACFFQPFH